MITLGIDAHRRTHTVVAVDDVGRQLGQKTTTATSSEDHLDMVRWADQFGPDRRCAVESDPIDALAVARAALRHPDLPAAHLDGPSRELRLLVDHREDLVAERTRCLNRLRWHLHELDASWDPRARSLTALKNLDAIAARLADFDGPVARIAIEITADAAIHRIAITQIRCHDDARAFIARRVNEHHNTKTEALRALKRRLSDVVYRSLLADTEPATAAPASTLARAA